MIEAMKRDLVEVISRHVEVDRDRIDVSFERQDRALAMLANIPIISVNRPNGNGARTTDATKASANPSAQTRPPTRRRRRRKKTPSGSSAPAQAGAT
jgi:cell division topological specificity factor